MIEELRKQEKVLQLEVQAAREKRREAAKKALEIRDLTQSIEYGNNLLEKINNGILLSQKYITGETISFNDKALLSKLEKELIAEKKEAEEGLDND